MKIAIVHSPGKTCLPRERPDSPSSSQRQSKKKKGRLSTHKCREQEKKSHQQSHRQIHTSSERELQTGPIEEHPNEVTDSFPIKSLQTESDVKISNTISSNHSHTWVSRLRVPLTTGVSGIGVLGETDHCSSVGGVSRLGVFPAPAVATVTRVAGLGRRRAPR